MKVTKTLGLAICLVAACGEGNSTSPADATSASAADAATEADAAAEVDASVSVPDAGEPTYSTAVTCGTPLVAAACPVGTWCVDTLIEAASGNSAVRGISVRSATDVWVVQPTPQGTQGGSFHRFDGNGWRLCSPENTLTDFSAVLAIGDNDALLGGSFGALFRFRNDQLTEIPFASSRTVHAIARLDDNQFLVGYDGGNIVRTDGVTATLEVALAGALDIRDFMVFAPNDVWAIGEAGVAAHFDGSSWTLTTTGTSQYLQGIWGATPDDVWAVDFSGAMLRWSGTAWASVADVDCFAPRGLYGRAANDIYAVCENTNPGPMFHWNGTSWTPDTTAPAIAGVAIHGAGGYVGVALTNGRILHRTD